MHPARGPLIDAIVEMSYLPPLSTLKAIVVIMRVLLMGYFSVPTPTVTTPNRWCYSTTLGIRTLPSYELGQWLGVLQDLDKSLTFCRSGYQSLLAFRIIGSDISVIFSVIRVLTRCTYFRTKPRGGYSIMVLRSKRKRLVSTGFEVVEVQPQ